ncbi:DNA repair protein RecO [Pseudotabrizicola sp. L79]|uniref:DNA repair protein RecO n=1 Tax=Pseudotabrizicola sp. L79 TaxID=3118402 RepID=UPI002F928ECE
MDWTDDAVVLSSRPHGEASAIVEVYAAVHGRHLGVVRGGASRKLAAHLQPGTQLAVTWRARLSDQLGSFTIEPVKSRAAVLEDPLALAGLASACALLHLALPERDPHAGLYAKTIRLLDDQASGGDWLAPYLRWELTLLEEIGFGLDLGSCAVTGARDDLAFVSPRTGRAVSRAGAGDWAPKLLPLPSALMGQGPVTRPEAAQALDLTGHFLTRALADRLPGGQLPEARARLLARLLRG